MAMNAPTDWLVCYDMADRKRLAQVFKLLKAHGIPLQRSVFQVHASSIAMEQLMAQISRLIQPDEDDVRAYRIPADSHKVWLGQSLIPQGMLIGCGAEARKVGLMCARFKLAEVREWMRSQHQTSLPKLLFMALAGVRVVRVD